ncbi:swr1 complex component [Blyttiomyces sp. JEL0837]|nr:swr1 complex component [Blyttiomyces sp. JEL0837]
MSSHELIQWVLVASILQATLSGSALAISLVSRILITRSTYDPPHWELTMFGILDTLGAIIIIVAYHEGHVELSASAATQDIFLFVLLVQIFSAVLMFCMSCTVLIYLAFARNEEARKWNLVMRHKIVLKPLSRSIADAMIISTMSIPLWGCIRYPWVQKKLGPHDRGVQAWISRFSVITAFIRAAAFFVTVIVTKPDVMMPGIMISAATSMVLTLAGVLSEAVTFLGVFAYISAQPSSGAGFFIGVPPEKAPIRNLKESLDRDLIKRKDESVVASPFRSDVSQILSMSHLFSVGQTARDRMRLIGRMTEFNIVVERVKDIIAGDSSRCGHAFLFEAEAVVDCDLPSTDVSRMKIEQKGLFKSLATVLLHVIRSKMGKMIQVVAFIVENIQWCDPASIEVLSHIMSAAKSSNLPTILIMTTRPTSPKSATHNGIKTLASMKQIDYHRLNGLTRAEAHSLLTSLPGSVNLPPEIVSGILDRAQGNPLMIHRWVETLTLRYSVSSPNRRMISSENMTLEEPQTRVSVTTVHGAPAALAPENVEVTTSTVKGIFADGVDLVERYLITLPTDEQELLEIISVIQFNPGLEFCYYLYKKSYEKGNINSFLKTLDSLIVKKILIITPMNQNIRNSTLDQPPSFSASEIPQYQDCTVEWNHESTRETAYRKLPQAKKTLVHGLAAKYIATKLHSQAHPAGNISALLEIALHLERSGSQDMATFYYVLAAEQDMKGHPAIIRREVLLHADSLSFRRPSRGKLTTTYAHTFKNQHRECVLCTMEYLLVKSTSTSTPAVQALDLFSYGAAYIDRCMLEPESMTEWGWFLQSALLMVEMSWFGAPGMDSNTTLRRAGEILSAQASSKTIGYASTMGNTEEEEDETDSMKPAEDGVIWISNMGSHPSYYRSLHNSLLAVNLLEHHGSQPGELLIAYGRLQQILAARGYIWLRERVIIKGRNLLAAMTADVMARNRGPIAFFEGMIGVAFGMEGLFERGVAFLSSAVVIADQLAATYPLSELYIWQILMLLDSGRVRDAFEIFNDAHDRHKRHDPLDSVTQSKYQTIHLILHLLTVSNPSMISVDALVIAESIAAKYAVVIPSSCRVPANVEKNIMKSAVLDSPKQDYTGHRTERIVSHSASRRSLIKRATFTSSLDLLCIGIAAVAATRTNNMKMARGLMSSACMRSNLLIKSGAAWIPGLSNAMTLLLEAALRGLLSPGVSSSPNSNSSDDHHPWVMWTQELIKSVEASCRYRPYLAVELAFAQVMYKRWEEGAESARSVAGIKKFRNKMLSVAKLAIKYRRRWWEGMIAAQVEYVTGSIGSDFEDFLELERDLGCSYVPFPAGTRGVDIKTSSGFHTTLYHQMTSVSSQQDTPQNRRSSLRKRGAPVVTNEETGNGTSTAASQDENAVSPLPTTSLRKRLKTQQSPPEPASPISNPQQPLPKQKQQPQQQQQTFQKQIPPPKLAQLRERKAGTRTSSRVAAASTCTPAIVSETEPPPEIEKQVEQPVVEEEAPVEAVDDGTIKGISGRTLKEYLSSFTWYDDEEINPAVLEARALSEADVLNRISKLQREGFLLGHTFETLKPRGPPPDPKTHYDYFLEGMRFKSARVGDERRMGLSNCRKISKAVERFWELKRTEGDRLAKSEERRLKKLAKMTAQEIVRKWKVIDAIVMAKYKSILKQAQQDAGKRQLHAIIERSTQFLSEAWDMESDKDAHSEEGESDRFDESDMGSREESDEDGDESSLDEVESNRDLGLWQLYQNEAMSDEGADESDYGDGHGGGEDDIATPDGPPTIDVSFDNGDETDATHTTADWNDTRQTARLSFGPLEPLETDDSSFEEGGLTAEMLGSDRDFEFSDNYQSSEDVEEVDHLEREALMPLDALRRRFSLITSNGDAGSSDGESAANLTPPISAAASPLKGSSARMTVGGKGLAPGVVPMSIDHDDGDEESGDQPGVNGNHKALEDVTMEIVQDSAVVDDEHDGMDESAMSIDGDLNETPKTGNATPESLEHDVQFDHTVEEEGDDDQAGTANAQSEPPETVDAPTGTTLTTTDVKVKVPMLLRHTLREYQHVGLDWLARLYNNGLNGILADEMGLGKTIQTIALIAYLAVEKAIWGPHLIVVPTSVMLNWESEFMKWCPGLKVLTYYGSQQQRKEKRTGWNKPNSFHVCITSYQMVLTDQMILKRKQWQYLILDEAHNIKNFRSQRWQTMLTFNAQRRLLLTGTPLQNNLMELWSLLYFLMPNGIAGAMPSGFANLKDFQEWFSKPVDKMVEDGEAVEVDEEVKGTIQRLHTVLRPYLLRRLKADVEKQMPSKTEHVVYCRLSLRQRFLYDDYMSRAKTREELASGNYMSIINCLMQLRKVCNHPDLFEVRPILTSFAMSTAATAQFANVVGRVRRLLRGSDPWPRADGRSDGSLDFVLIDDETTGPRSILEDLAMLDPDKGFEGVVLNSARNEIALRSVCGPTLSYSNVEDYRKILQLRRATETTLRWHRMRILNRSKCHVLPFYSRFLLNCTRSKPFGMLRTAAMVFGEGQEDPSLFGLCPDASRLPRRWNDPTQLLASPLIMTYRDRADQLDNELSRFAFVTPRVKALGPVPGRWGADVSEELVVSTLTNGSNTVVTTSKGGVVTVDMMKKATAKLCHVPDVRLTIAFPDKWLLQFDCGKLQTLDLLLRQLRSGGHRALIFTQMTRMLDILEQFLNLHGYIYLRLDGSTKVEERKHLMDRFNSDTRILAFILSTRSGGVGMNLTGADSVIFYDSDWNPAMDAQAQDRAHRIGQTRDVHIYRLISEHTIEENILKKANMKRRMDSVVIQEGEFTTDFMKKVNWRDWMDDNIASLVEGEAEGGEVADGTAEGAGPRPALAVETGNASWEEALQAVEDESDVVAMREARKELDLDRIEFEEAAANAGLGGSTAVTPVTPEVSGGPSSTTPTGAIARGVASGSSGDMPATTAVTTTTVTIADSTTGAAETVSKTGLEAERGIAPIETPAQTQTQTQTQAQAQGEVESAEETIGHIDDYMLRYWIWKLNIPLSYRDFLAEDD